VAQRLFPFPFLKKTSLILPGYRGESRAESSEGKPHVLVTVNDALKLKGTWQRGGFSGVFAEIGTA
jgi:hypothetical protein